LATLISLTNTWQPSLTRIIEKTRSEFRKLSVQMMYVLLRVTSFVSKA
jgi:hypothetical protein